MTGVALVTGGSARIGLAITRQLAAAGYDVLVHASPRSLPRARAVVETIVAAGHRAKALAADLSDPRSCARLMEQAGPDIRLLVNNAAIFEADTAAAPDLALLERHHAINLRAPLMLASLLHAMRSGEADTCVVNVIDQRVLHPDGCFFSYTLAKSALWTATQAMARAFAAKGVRVNAVGPGPVLPNAIEGDTGFEQEVAALPLRRAVLPDEIAAAVLYLAQARAVTGQFLAVDAGQHLARR